MAEFPALSGNVYFIATEQPFAIKIGYTAGHPAKRLRALQTGSPVPLHLLGWYPGSQQDERELHQQMAPFHISGEWFRMGDGVNDILRGPFLCMQINNRLTGHDPDAFA
jgi:hypothetical protein